MSKNTHGGDIYRHKNVTDYSSNCNPFGAPAGVVHAICSAASEINHYPDVNASELREALSAHLGVSGDKIFFGNGAAEVILDLVFALKPRRALLTAPSFSEYGEALGAVGCDIKYHKLYEEKDFTIEEDILDAITEDLDIMFVCNPNNPTGALTEKVLMERIAHKCADIGVTLVVDECFMDFIEERARYSVQNELERFPNLVILKAFTKLYAMAGVRLGYCLSANSEIMEALDHVRQPWNISNLAQAAGVAALQEEEYVATSLAAIEAERVRLIASLEGLGLKVYGSNANYIFFQGPKDLYDKCLEKGFLIRDCSNYQGLGKGFWRIAVKLREENDRFMAAMEEILK